MELPHFESLAALPSHLLTRSQLKALGLTPQGLTRVATVLSFGKAIPVYDASHIVKVQTASGLVTQPH